MLRLISYLAPSIPYEFFELVARVISEGTGLQVGLWFEERISGPLPGDKNPFTDGSADIGFLCGPSYRWLKHELELFPVPVPIDARAGGRPVYFGDVVVKSNSRFRTFDDLRLARWAYNDRNSRSGWLSMVERVEPMRPEEFFSEIVQAGSHLESLQHVKTGSVDAAAIDSNTWLNQARRHPELATELRILESWGPFPIQPVVLRGGVPEDVKLAIRKSLLCAHGTYGAQLNSFGFARFMEGNAADYD